MNDLRDKIIYEVSTHNCYQDDADETADAILATVEAQHRAELEAVREWCVKEAENERGKRKGTKSTDGLWTAICRMRDKPIDEILKEACK